MAEHKPTAGSVLLFIDPAGGTSYDTVVCLRTVSKKATVNAIDASSACGAAKEAGTLEISYDVEGVVLQDPTSGTLSATDLRQLCYAKTTIGYKIAPETPVTGDETEVGTAFISDISSDYSYNDVATFSMTLQPKGEPTISVT